MALHRKERSHAHNIIISPTVVVFGITVLGERVLPNVGQRDSPPPPPDCHDRQSFSSPHQPSQLNIICSHRFDYYIFFLVFYYIIIFFFTIINYARRAVLAHNNCKHYTTTSIQLFTIPITTAQTYCHCYSCVL